MWCFDWNIQEVATVLLVIHDLCIYSKTSYVFKLLNHYTLYACSPPLSDLHFSVPTYKYCRGTSPCPSLSVLQGASQYWEDSSFPQSVPRACSGHWEYGEDSWWPGLPLRTEVSISVQTRCFTSKCARGIVPPNPSQLVVWYACYGPSAIWDAYIDIIFTYCIDQGNTMYNLAE